MILLLPLHLRECKQLTTGILLTVYYYSLALIAAGEHPDHTRKQHVNVKQGLSVASFSHKQHAAGDSYFINSLPLALQVSWPGVVLQR